jgi:hypothetical protein
VSATCIDGPQWFEEDFGDQAREEAETDGDAEDEEEDWLLKNAVRIQP